MCLCTLSLCLYAVSLPKWIQASHHFGAKGIGANMLLRKLTCVQRSTGITLKLCFHEQIVQKGTFLLYRQKSHDFCCALNCIILIRKQMLSLDVKVSQMFTVISAPFISNHCLDSFTVSFFTSQHIVCSRWKTIKPSNILDF